ncbi:MAG: PDZ domain-containing protein [Phycisphaerae bacterium]|jgi:serine protease Do
MSVSNGRRVKPPAGVLALPLAAVLSTGLRLAAAEPSATLQPDRADQLRREIHQMISAARDRVFPSLVNIHVVTVQYYGGQEHKGRSVGSGTVITDQGHVLTNQHVTNEGRKFTCTLANKEEVSARLIGEDPLTDLAVLQLDLSAIKDPAGRPPAARFGDSDELTIGDYVLAMGSPRALSRSVTLGIVSNPERVFAGGALGGDGEDMELEEGQRTGLFTRWLQHDALIQPGNSGGPLVNLKGEIVGINELGGASLGFAIPSNLARTVAEALIRHGEVSRSWIGVAFKPIDKTGLSQGVLVNSVVKDGPAGQAGIRAGDVIVELEGRPVTVRFPEEVPPLLKRVADLPIGSGLRVAYLRDGRRSETVITTRKFERDRGREKAFRTWGLTAREITPKLAQDWRLDDTRGVLVSSVRQGGPGQSAEPALNYGDVIRAVEGRPVPDLKTFVEIYDQIADRKPPPEQVLIEFDRRGKNHVTLLKPRADKDDERPREVAKAWIGIATQPVLRELAERLGVGGVRGFRVTRVYPGTRAAESGLRTGDIITALDGKRLSPAGMQDSGLLARAIRQLDIGGQTTLSVLRGQEKLEITVPLERTRLTPEDARREINRDFELTVREVTFFDRDENRWDDDVKGVLVEQVESAGWADLGGIQYGDLIQRIDANEIADLAGFRKAMQKIAADQPKRVVMVVLRGARTHFQYLEPEWKPETDDAGSATQPAKE